MKNKYSTILILFFSFVGILFTSTVTHELTHYLQFKDEFKITEVCLFELPTTKLNSPVAYVQVELNETNREQFIRKKVPFELWAYVIGLIPVGIYIFALMRFLNGFLENEKYLNYKNY